MSLYKGDITVLEVDAIVNAGKNLSFLRRDMVFSLFFFFFPFLKVAYFLHCTLPPSAVKIEAMRAKAK